MHGQIKGVSRVPWEADYNNGSGDRKRPPPRRTPRRCASRGPRCCARSAALAVAQETRPSRLGKRRGPRGWARDAAHAEKKRRFLSFGSNTLRAP
eukprot:2816331-Pleurochrysis_carterae.AAC.3